MLVGPLMAGDSPRFCGVTGLLGFALRTLTPEIPPEHEVSSSVSFSFLNMCRQSLSSGIKCPDLFVPLGLYSFIPLTLAKGFIQSLNKYLLITYAVSGTLL